MTDDIDFKGRAAQEPAVTSGVRADGPEGRVRANVVAHVFPANALCLQRPGRFDVRMRPHASGPQ